jgi:hypothetical protein
VSDRRVRVGGKLIPASTRTLRLSGIIVTSRSGHQLFALDARGEKSIKPNPDQATGGFHLPILYGQYHVEWDNSRDWKGVDEGRRGSLDRVVELKSSINMGGLLLEDPTAFAPVLDPQSPRKFKWTIQDEQTVAGVRLRTFRQMDGYADNPWLDFAVSCAAGQAQCALRDGLARIPR